MRASYGTSTRQHEWRNLEFKTCYDNIFFMAITYSNSNFFTRRLLRGGRLNKFFLTLFNMPELWKESYSFNYSFYGTTYTKEMKSKQAHNFNGCIPLYRVRHLTFFSTSTYFVMVTLSSCLIWQIISFILPPNEYGCVYAWTTLGSGPAIDLQKMPILAKKKIVFSYEAHFDLGGYVNMQNCQIWGTENQHAYLEDPKHPKRVTVWGGFWSRSIIGPIFFRKWARRGRYSQWWS